MATTSALIFCPKCGIERLNSSKKSCQLCGHSFVKPISEFFDTPDYLFYQMEDYKNQFDPERRTDKAPTEEEIKKLEEAKKALKAWLIACPPEDKKAAMGDALLILSNVLFSETCDEELQALISIGKKIGHLATAIEQYLHASGRPLHVRETRPLYPDANDATWSTATAGRSGD